MDNEISRLIEEKTALKKRIIGIEDRDRRKNLIIWNLKEDGKENPRDIAQGFFREMLSVDIDKMDFERVHRLHTRTSPRPMIVRFERYAIREEIWKRRHDNAQKLKTSEYRLSEDFSYETRKARGKLRPIAEKAWSEGKPAYLKVDKLFIGNDIHEYDEASDDVVIHTSTKKERGRPVHRTKRQASSSPRVTSRAASNDVIGSPARRPKTDIRFYGRNSTPKIKNKANGDGEEASFSHC